jgi:hypothetical protein
MMLTVDQYDLKQVFQQTIDYVYTNSDLKPVSFLIQNMIQNHNFLSHTSHYMLIFELLLKGFYGDVQLFSKISTEFDNFIEQSLQLKNIPSSICNIPNQTRTFLNIPYQTRLCTISPDTFTILKYYGIKKVVIHQSVQLFNESVPPYNQQDLITNIWEANVESFKMNASTVGNIGVFVAKQSEFHYDYNDNYNKQMFTYENYKHLYTQWNLGYLLHYCKDFSMCIAKLITPSVFTSKQNLWLYFRVFMLYIIVSKRLLNQNDLVRLTQHQEITSTYNTMVAAQYNITNDKPQYTEEELEFWKKAFNY